MRIKLFDKYIVNPVSGAAEWVEEEFKRVSDYLWNLTDKVETDFEDVYTYIDQNSGPGGGGSLTVSDTPPVSPSNGDQWLDSKLGVTATWYQDADSGQWVSDPLENLDLGPGATAHGALTGLAVDDHLQYHTDARGDARYALIGSYDVIECGTFS